LYLLLKRRCVFGNAYIFEVILIMKMHSLVSIVGVALNGKEIIQNGQERSSILLSSMIFGMAFVMDILHLPNLQLIKSLQWMNTYKKAYALIDAFVSDEVSHHIKSIKDSWVL
jgi:hypothetical protein